MISCSPLSVSTGAPGGLTLQFSAPTTTVGSRAVYSCRSSGYQLVGKAERVCGTDGNWTEEEPHCEGYYDSIVSVYKCLNSAQLITQKPVPDLVYYLLEQWRMQ